MISHITGKAHVRFLKRNTTGENKLKNNNKTQSDNFKKSSGAAIVIKPTNAYGDELRWGNVPPNKEGWWWHRFSDYSDINKEPLIGITEVCEFNDELFVYLEYSKNERTLKEHLEIIKQTAIVHWAGPIAFPID